jgi:alpha-1,6-mannosyltransferase
LALADIYVTAGTHETFALSLVKAQAAGRPVVGVDSDAHTQRVPEGVGLAGPVGDAAKMADNIVKVANHKEEMAAKARLHVQAAGFGWETAFDLLFSHYHRLAGAMVFTNR